MPTRAISWAALLVALPGVAIAADLPNKKAPAPAPLMFSWGGLYVGTSVGYGFSTLNETGVDPLTPAFSGLAAGPVAYQQSYSPRGVQTGAHVGYLKQYGHFVLGGEADVDYATNNTSKTLFNGLGVVTNGPFQTSIQDNLRASLVGKAGYADGRSLYYVLGGLSIGDTQVRHNYWGMPSTYTSFGYSTPNPNNDINNIERFGWTVGAGLEYAFTDHWSANVEYRHSDFGTATVTSTGNQNSGIGPNTLAAGGIFGLTFKERETEDSIRLGINYHIGMPEMPVMAAVAPKGPTAPPPAAAAGPDLHRPPLLRL